MPVARSYREHWACLLVVIVLAGTSVGVLAQVVSSLAGNAAHFTSAPLPSVPAFMPR